MANNAYLRGRKLEWDVQKLFRNAGFRTIRASGSHGLADVVVFRDGGALDITKPITVCEMDEVLGDWITVQDRDLILEPYLYGRKQFKAHGGDRTLHMTPVSAWIIQCKDTTKKKKKKKGK